MSWPNYLHSFKNYGNSMIDVMFTYMKGFVDQGFNLAHFHAEQIFGEHPKIDTVWLLGELDRLLFINDKPNV